MTFPPKTYAEWVEALIALRASAASLHEHNPTPPVLPTVTPNAPTVVICSPHPDDEVIVGLLPFRLRKAGWRVVNFAMTLGSCEASHARRRAELEKACRFLGFQCQYPFADASGAYLRSQAHESAYTVATATFHQQLQALQPKLVLSPHLQDGHPTHMAVGRFIEQALLTSEFKPNYWAQTEYWATMTRPNCLVEATPAELACLVGALALHQGEVTRNPYHLTLPAWMEDSARRGAELLGGFGSSHAPNFRFASAYQIHAFDPDKTLRPLKPNYSSTFDDINEVFL